MVLAARSVAERTPDYIEPFLRWTMGLLRDARPSSAALKAALDALEARLEAIGARPPPPGWWQRWPTPPTGSWGHRSEVRPPRAYRRAGPTPPDTLRVLTIGANGESSGGLSGTVTGILGEAATAGPQVYVWLSESRPTLLGARIGTVEHEHARIPYGLIADGTAGSLMAGNEIDVVMVGAERVAGNGDVAAIAGTYPLAVLAQRHGLPFYVCVLQAAVDPLAPDAASCPNAQLPAHMLTSYRGGRIALASGDARVPWLDMTPADLVTAFITDWGLFFLLLRRGGFDRFSVQSSSPGSPPTPLNSRCSA